MRFMIIVERVEGGEGGEGGGMSRVEDMMKKLDIATREAAASGA